MRAHVLFCGLGGSTEGMVRAGLDVRGAIDAWPVAVEAHRRWHPSIPVVHGDCEDAGLLLGKPVDLIWASPSCRPWSTANRTPKRGPAHPDYYPLAELVRQSFDGFRARWLIIENVGGLIWSREGKIEMGLLAAEVRRRPGLTWTTTVVRACDHGVPQLRRRPIIVVGPGLCPILAGQATAGETGAVSCTRDGSGGSNARKAARARAVGTSDYWHRQGPGAHTSWKPAQAVTGARDGGGHPGPSRRHARHAVMANEREGWYVRAAYANGGTGHDPRTGEANYHEGRSLAECARLQCLPMEPLAGLTKTAAHRLVGNAVPPPVAEWVCRCVLATDRRLRA